MTESHVEGSKVSPAPHPDKRDKLRFGLISIAVPLIIAIIAIAFQQMLFRRFWHAEGISYGLFSRPDGEFYRLWTDTIPFYAASALLAAVGIVGSIRWHIAGYRWYGIIVWLIYVAILWTLVVASSALLDIIGTGKAFL